MNFSEYRDRQVHVCSRCSAEIASYRNCTGEYHCCNGKPDKNDGQLKFVRIEEGKRMADIDIGIQIGNFKPFFCTGTGTTIESKTQRDQIAKKNGWLFGDDKDFVSQAAQNKKDTEKRAKEKFSSGMKEALYKGLN